MSTETEHVSTGTAEPMYVNAIVAGIVAGLVFGVMIQFVLERMTTIGALYTLGEPSLSIGWIAHIAHSGLFAVVYALVTRHDAVSAYADGVTTGVATGAAFGFLLWFVNIGFVWPVWLNLVSIGLETLPVPYHADAMKPLVGHLVWGGLMGGLYPLLGSVRR